MKQKAQEVQESQTFKDIKDRIEPRVENIHQVVSENVSALRSNLEQVKENVRPSVEAAYERGKPIVSTAYETTVQGVEKVYEEAKKVVEQVTKPKE